MKQLIFYIFLLSTVSLNAQVRYVTTLYPFKMIIERIVGERGEVDEILPPGASPHTYELKPSEIKKAEKATALFYGADNLDGWVLKLDHPESISLFGLLPAQNQLAIKNYAGRSADEVIGSDPHFWTDPLAVKVMLPALVDTLCALDPEGWDTYRKNSLSFSNKLDSLEIKIHNAFSQIRNKSVILAHPFFQYFLKRFGFRVEGIIETIPGKESTPRELKEIIDRANEHNVKVILTHPQSSDRPARLVAEATKAKVVELDPIGGVAGREAYDELLLYNTQILLKAFNE